MEGGPVESFLGVCGMDPVLAVGLMLKEPFAYGAGEASGESDGKETRDLAEFGVTRDCLRDLVRTVPGRCEVEFVEAVEAFRCGRFSRSLSITKSAQGYPRPGLLGVKLDIRKCGRKTPTWHLRRASWMRSLALRHNCAWGRDI